MKKHIAVHNTCEKLDSSSDTLSVYLNLHTIFAHDQLFLLESLYGPQKDRKASFVGFNPLLTLALHKTRLTLSGDPALISALNPLLNHSPYLKKIDDQRYDLIELPMLWNFLREMESLFNVDYSGEPLDIRFGFFGYFGYDIVHAIESLPHRIEDPTDFPELMLSLYQGMVYTDLAHDQTYLIINEFETASYRSADNIKMLLSKPVTPADPLSLPVPAPENITDSIRKKDYLPWVDRALEHIGLGDIYQIQIGHMLTITSSIDPFLVYQRLRVQNPSPYMYFTTMNGVTIIGASPELFMSQSGRKITMRPIAGTIRRGRNAQEDAQLKAELLADPKEQAEHVMLVDLGRNDIGRVCEKNTLNVSDLMIVEQYSHVFHIVSNVEGQLATNYDHYDVIKATFPAGTVTGAPRIRAMELIEDIENKRRGLYAGCLGFFDVRGNFETALCIRTAVYRDGQYMIRASGGIVADSDPSKEWAETISKLSSTYLAITGRELRDEHFIN